jgi:DNA helicase-2/ATP-dependent DNA helicase PcrA
MAAFARMYDQPARITLEENFRSNANILQLSETVAEQIGDRLESVITDAHKQLTAKRTYETKALERLSFPSELAQYDWIAGEIARLVENGAKPEDIAIIAPRHRYLERLMPYLRDKRVPVAYERRDNILDAPIIVELLTMAGLIVALAANRQDDADALFGEVLGYDFWGLSTETLLQVSLNAYDNHKHWLEVLAAHKDKRLRDITAWLVRLAKRSSLEPMEYIIDELVGAGGEGVDSEYDDLLLPAAKAEKFVSPLRQYYFNPARYETATDTYLTLLGQFSTLRHRLRQWQPHRTLYVKDLVAFADLHRSANLKITDTNPHTQTTNAVQVMTAYKAKGLEFGAVFVINAQDEVWGPTARSGSSRVALPRNLPIAPVGDSDDDRLRLLFVALTRAKHTLFITSYTHNLDNKLSPSLSFLAGNGELPPRAIDKPATEKAAEILSKDWAYRFRQVIADKPSLFAPILADYKLSVTHLNNFIDLVNAGPQYFLTHNLLRFPEAISPSAAYGDAVHKTLQWAYAELRDSGSLPSIAQLQSYFADILARAHLQPNDHKRLDKRGHEALERYISARSGQFSPQDMVERGFNNEGVVINGAHLSGKIDLMHRTETGRVEVRDFKTGKPAASWQGKDEFEKVKLHKYRQQLLFYKLLVEQSASFHKRLAVVDGALEFIEADENGKLVANLDLEFDPTELERFTRLIGAVWTHIMRLDFPDTSQYAKNLKGIQQFEDDLISNAN